jgi:hypothetical protein
MCGQDGCLGRFYNVYVVMLKALFDNGGLRLEDLVQTNSYVWTLMGDLNLKVTKVTILSN